MLPQPAPAEDQVFVVHGQNAEINTSAFALLRAVRLDPIEWDSLVSRTIADLNTGGNPPVFQIIEHGFAITSGCVVIFTPDELAEYETCAASVP